MHYRDDAVADVADVADDTVADDTVADDTVADGRSKQAARTHRKAMAAPGGGSGVRDVAGGPEGRVHHDAGAEALEPSDGGGLRLINHQPSTINHQPSTIRHQPSTI